MKLPDVVITARADEIAGMGAFLSSWQNPLSTGGRFGEELGQTLNNPWIKLALTTVEAVTSPALFAGRKAFEATDFGQQLNEEVEKGAAQIMEAGTGYVDAEGRIKNLQKSSEMMGGLMLGGTLALGGFSLFGTVAPKVTSFFAKVDDKLSRGDTNFGGVRGGFSTGKYAPAHTPAPAVTQSVRVAPKPNAGSDNHGVTPTRPRANTSTPTLARRVPGATAGPNSNGVTTGRNLNSSDSSVGRANGPLAQAVPGGKTPDLIPEKKVANGADYNSNTDLVSKNTINNVDKPDRVPGNTAKSPQASAGQKGGANAEQVPQRPVTLGDANGRSSNVDAPRDQPRVGVSDRMASSPVKSDRVDRLDRRTEVPDRKDVVSSEVAALRRIAANNKAASPRADARIAHQKVNGRNDVEPVASQPVDYSSPTRPGGHIPHDVNPHGYLVRKRTVRRGSLTTELII